MLLNIILRCLEVDVYFFLAILKTNLYMMRIFFRTRIKSLEKYRFGLKKKCMKTP